MALFCGSYAYAFLHGYVMKLDKYTSQLVSLNEKRCKKKQKWVLEQHLNIV